VGTDLEDELRAWLRQDEGLFQFLHALPNDGMLAWRLGPHGDVAASWLSPSLVSTLGGHAGATTPTLAWLEQQLVVADRDRLRAALRASDGALPGAPADEVLHGAALDGSPRQLRWRARCQAGATDGLRIAVLTRLRPSRELDLRSVADELPLMAWTCDRRGRVDYVNPWGFAFTGLDPATNLVDFGAKALHPDDVRPVLTAWQVARSTGTEIRIDARIRRADGEYLRFEHRARRVDDPHHGERWFGTSVDVDDARTAHDAAHTRSVELAALLETTPHAIFALEQNLSGERRIPLASPAVEALFGVPASELTVSSTQLSTRCHPDDLPRMQREAAAALEANCPWVMRFRYHHPATGERVIDGHAMPERQGDLIRWNVVAYDVTHHGTVERLARLAPPRRGAAASTGAPEVFYILDLRTQRLRFVSDGFDRLWGVPRERAYADARAWTQAVHDEDRARVAARFDAARPDDHVETSYRVVRPDGSVRWIHDRAFIAADGHGDADRALGIAIDVTAEHVATTQLRHAEKMEALGHLVSGVAHDFNNLLWVIHGNSSLLLGEAGAGLPPAARDSLEDIRAAAERATALVRQLLLFARGDTHRPADLDLNTVLDETSQLLRRVLGSSVQVEVEPHATPLTVHIDRNVLDQVLLNLAVNARDAMPGGGRLTLRSRSVVSDGAPTSTGRRRGAFACLEVTDTGAGMAPAVQARIFEPFFTTKESGHGGGLGLATVASIVQRHQGWLEVDSAVGAGTTMRVYLPLVGPRGAAPQPEPPIGAGQVVAVCEPDVAERERTTHLLRGLGYEVVAFANVEAVRERWPGLAPHVAVFVAPLELGGGLLGELRAAAAGVAIVLTSAEAPLDGPPDVHYLPRPVVGAALATAVASALRARTPTGGER
jgi:two-component system cell cycle sensor histidine kinase/response regulator CckA